MMSTTYLCALHVLLTLAVHTSMVYSVIREFTAEEQQEAIIRVAIACLKQMSVEENNTLAAVNSAVNGSERTCLRDFDKLTCWPPTAANHTVSLPCPSYVHLFDSEESSSRYCTPAGTWSVKPSNNRSTGNYTKCYENSLLLQRRAGEMYGIDPEKILLGNSVVKSHLTYLQIIYTTGNSISITALLIALLLFTLFRKKLLACSRNIIHTNMFVSFILRGVLTLIHFFVTSKQEANMELSYKFDANSSNYIVDNSQLDWTCKLGTSVWMYTRLTNFMWIFLEGLYLHLLMFVITFNDNIYTYRLVAAGWGIPLVFIIPWVAARLAVDDHKCWVNYQNRNLRWIVETPVIIIVIVNFGFFISFLKLLSTKIKSSQANGIKQNYGRKLAKSTFVLLPLFGIHYITFLFTDLYPNISKNATLELIALYFDTLFTSFQGLAVAVLFCFYNSEVISEVQKIWVRLKVRHGIFRKRRRGSSPTQRVSMSSDTAVTFMSRRRSSSHGMLNFGLTSKSKATPLRRELSIPQPIDEEQYRLVVEEDTNVDENHNSEIRSIVSE